MIVIRNSQGQFYWDGDGSNSHNWMSDFKSATRYHNIKSAEFSMKLKPHAFNNEGARVTEMEIA